MPASRRIRPAPMPDYECELSRRKNKRNNQEPKTYFPGGRRQPPESGLCCVGVKDAADCGFSVAQFLRHTRRVCALPNIRVTQIARRCLEFAHDAYESAPFQLPCGS
ncbi:unnamed protein product, partial [Iphiclides podalirius]